MAVDVEPTELDELEVSKVSGVEGPANGVRWLVLKAADDSKCSTCNGTGKIMDGHRDCPDCAGPVGKAEADEIEDELTGDDNDDATKALSAKDRDAMPASNFAYVDADGGKHLPIHDEGHTRAAMGRLGQTDFSNAKGGDAGKAKALAARKIKAAAAKHGIDVDDSSDVAAEAKKTLQLTKEEAADLAGMAPVEKSPGVPDESVATPTVGGEFPSGQSSLGESVTAGAVVLDEEPPLIEGGQTTYTLPAEAKADLTKNAVAFTASSLVEAIDKIAEQREAIEAATKAGLTLTPPSSDEASTPGNMPWENYDSATLGQVAMCLAACGAAIDAIKQREQTEALTADPGDITDVWDLSDAESAMDYAVGIIARLSFSEAVEAGTAEKAEPVEKVGRKLSGKTEGVLRAARDHLTSVIGDGDENKAGDGSDSDEGDKIQMEVTKTEFTESVIAIAQEVLKNANNGGDISEGEIHPSSTQDADDISIPGSGSSDPGVTKETAGDEPTEDIDVAKQLQALTEKLGSVGEVVAKMAKQPRRGVGPILDGQPRPIPAEEGRQGEVAKSDAENKIEQLQKALDEATAPADKDRLSYDLTLEKLKLGHELGVI